MHDERCSLRMDASSSFSSSSSSSTAFLFFFFFKHDVEARTSANQHNHHQQSTNCVNVKGKKKKKKKEEERKEKKNHHVKKIHWPCPWRHIFLRCKACAWPAIANASCKRFRWCLKERWYTKISSNTSDPRRGSRFWAALARCLLLLLVFTYVQRIVAGCQQNTPDSHH